MLKITKDAISEQKNANKGREYAAKETPANQKSVDSQAEAESNQSTRASEDPRSRAVL